MSEINRNEVITFDELNHRYYINGVEVKRSVTQLVEEFFPRFDSDKVIRKMKTTGKYQGMTPEKIKSYWNELKEAATREGTRLHRSIELFYKSNSDNDPSPEFKYFKDFHNTFINDTYKPYKSEWQVFSDGYEVAGTIDMVYKSINKNDEYIIVDWKRSKQIKKDNPYECGFEPFHDLPNTNFYRYSVQLNLYKYIVERFYGLRIAHMYIVCLHPNNETYLREEIEDYKDRIQKVFAMLRDK